MFYLTFYATDDRNTATVNYLPQSRTKSICGEYQAVFTAKDLHIDLCTINTGYFTVDYYELVQNYRYLLEDKHVLYVISEDPVKLLDYIALDSWAMVNKTRKALGYEVIKRDKNELQPFSREYGTVQDSETGRYLSEVLAQCPKVKVTKPELISVRQFVSKQRKKLRELLDKEHEIYEVIDLLRYTRNTAIMLTMMLNDNKQLTEYWSYPETREQFIALCLMQSYTKHFNSCQYLSVHSLSLDEVKRALTFTESNDIVAALDLENVNSHTCYRVDQFNDFNLCDRFFQLDDEGYVSKRFTLYYDCSGKVALDNFYNTSERGRLTIGNITVEEEDDFGIYKGDTYKNDELPLAFDTLYK